MKPMTIFVVFILAVAAVAVAGCAAQVEPVTATEAPAATAATAANTATMAAPADPTEPALNPSPVRETPMPNATQAAYDPAMEPIVQIAVSDLAQRLNIPKDQISVVEAKAMVWSDTSMGCPQPGMAYIQVPQDGALVRLSAGGQEYAYHNGGSKMPFLCEK